jgi:hypothetical protein
VNFVGAGNDMLCMHRKVGGNRATCVMSALPGAGAITNAISVFGFAFYIQPLMMPMLVEMPEGGHGLKMLSYATRVAVLGEG